MLDDVDQKYMMMAIDKAREGVDLGQTPFGACIVKDQKVISCEHNIVWESTDITAHGEVNAIRKACKNTKSISLSGGTIYSTCEPCPMCFSAIHWAGITRIVFGLSIGDAKKFGFRELCISNEQMKKVGELSVSICGGIMKEDNEKLFRYWQEKNPGTTY